MKNLVMILAFCVLAGCGTINSKKKHPTEENIKITDTLRANRYGNIYFSAQPDKASLKQLKDKGFRTVINLRGKEEGAYKESDERKKIKSEGLNYYNIPFDMKKKLTREYVKSVTKKVVKHRSEGKVLVHCSSGNRVGVWLGAHFKDDHKLSDEESVDLAKELGLNNPKAISKLRSYLQENE